MDDTPHAAADKPRVAITYCTQCNWLLRAAWMAQELLSTFRDDLGEVALIPATGGAFSITLGADTVWERTGDGGFPDVKVLKQRVRDRLDPGRDLGHIDRARPEPYRSDPTKSDPPKSDP
ncbi:SelT/SelW/SelH family protein [Methylobacterium sp. WL103]|uniref:SelT/SelW/SelH family protein n=1 Tax=Methylobacterium sp. WL103 TaxID=2603891 RepID=UPI0011CB5017|nr:SelT/SelW/SelH family protein [Methylobacterium sp. WL103]TXM91261.1 SelT/SelW/SelH family protein [Methylobacterium sp. WL103]